MISISSVHCYTLAILLIPIHSLWFNYHNGPKFADMELPHAYVLAEAQSKCMGIKSDLVFGSSGNISCYMLECSCCVSCTSISEIRRLTLGEFQFIRINGVQRRCAGHSGLDAPAMAKHYGVWVSVILNVFSPCLSVHSSFQNRNTSEFPFWECNVSSLLASSCIVQILNKTDWSTPLDASYRWCYIPPPIGNSVADHKNNTVT